MTERKGNIPWPFTLLLIYNTYVMKYLASILLVLCAVLCSCSKDEPKGEKLLPVVEAYSPATLDIDIDKPEWTDVVKKWDNKKIVVNSLSDIPDDPFGISDAFRNIDFNKCTLLLAYQAHNYPVNTYRNRYYKDETQDTYNWMVIVGTTDAPDQWGEQWYFSRYALLVDKLPTGAQVKFGLVSPSISWD